MGQFVGDIIYASIVIAYASFAQAVTGVGFVMVATPFLLDIMNVKDTVVLGFCMSLVSQVIIVCKTWRVIHPRMFFNFILGSALGAPLGFWVFSVTSFAFLKLTVGIVLLSISSFSLYRIYDNWRLIDSTTTYQRLSGSRPLWSMKGLLKLDGTGRVQLFIGSVAGFFGASIGMPGIPLSVYFSAVNVDKEVARCTTLSFFIVLVCLTLAANYTAGTISATVYRMAPLLIPSVIIGMLIGDMVFPHIPQRWFQLILNSIIFYSAFRILFEFI